MLLTSVALMPKKTMVDCVQRNIGSNVIAERPEGSRDWIWAYLHAFSSMPCPDLPPFLFRMKTESNLSHPNYHQAIANAYTGHNHIS